MNKKIKISIITAVYNRVSTIAHSIESVQSQYYPFVEHIIQDGGSTDGTMDIIQDIATERTKIESASDGGIYEAFNRAIDRTTGDIVGFMHSDDFFSNREILSRVAERLSETSSEGLYGDLEYVSSRDPGRTIRYWRSGAYQRSKLALGWMPPHPTLYLRRSVYERLGGFDTKLRISADYEAMLRYLVKGSIDLEYLPEVMVKMRTGGASNGSFRRIIKKSREDLIAIRRHNIGGVGTLAMKNLRKLEQFRLFG